MRKFCSKGIFKLEMRDFWSYWHGRCSTSHPETWNKRVSLGATVSHSKPDCTSRKLFIYHVFHQFFLCSFSSILSIFTAATSFVFLSLGIWFREKSPTPPMNSRSSKICVWGPWCRLTPPLGLQIRVLAHYTENQARSLQFYQTFYSISAPDLSGLDFIDWSFNTNSVPNGSIHIWKEDLGKKREQSKM